MVVIVAHPIADITDTKEESPMGIFLEASLADFADYGADGGDTGPEYCFQT